MRIRKWLLPLLAVILVVCAAIGSASAYFTSNAAGKGGYVLHLGNKTEIEEQYGQRSKIVKISNSEKNATVFVRVKGFSGSQYPLSYSGTNWEPDPNKEGFWRYKLPVAPGSSTADALTIQIDSIPENLVKDDSFNVIVVCESVPALFKADGSPDLDGAWTVGEVTVVERGNG